MNEEVLELGIFESDPSKTSEHGDPSNSSTFAGAVRSRFQSGIDEDPPTPVIGKKNMSSFQGNKRIASPPSQPQLKRGISSPARWIDGDKKKLNEIDLAIIYSSPLIELVEKKNIAMELLLRCDQYNFGDEVYDYIKLLTKTKKELTVHAECVSFDKFIRLMMKHPKIVHLNCHADWDQDSKHCCLFFENRQLELQRVSPQDIKIKDNWNQIEVFILSAPYCKVSLEV